ncbi:hypothetical protein [Wielerella bovis]|uniref:hypothetical protein n=1 Tax=Wielerella bovis TaxID=2917790 RepID=UPI0020199029|nr:hypothetical protein [Wielerella bovis]MCG7656654.1 hypothetical protein [Wielerella bovis]MCG7658879.1 hypothetical protein [Wielerella bovis]
MEKQSNVGICELCGNEAVLQDSHFIPKAIYKKFSNIKEKGTSLYLMNNGESFPLSTQIKAHKFCSKCEGLFSKNGEQYFIDNALYQRALISEEQYSQKPENERRFKSYQEYIKNNIPYLVRFFIENIGYTTNIIEYIKPALSETEIDSLCYFAISIFWRGSLQWAIKPQYNLPNDVLREMKDYLLQKNKNITTFVIKIDISPPCYYVSGVNFPAKIRDDLYRFSIDSFIFTLEILTRPSSNGEYLLFGFNFPIAKSNFENFKRLFDKSEKKGNVPDELHYLKK